MSKSTISISRTLTHPICYLISYRHSKCMQIFWPLSFKEQNIMNIVQNLYLAYNMMAICGNIGTRHVKYVRTKIMNVIRHFI
jgi:hypothetical protein